jgi:hypothetical protein
VVIDCTHLGFCDSTTLNAMLHLRWQAQARHVPLSLAAPGTRLTRLLEISGATGLFSTHPTLSDALRAHRATRQPAQRRAPSSAPHPEPTASRTLEGLLRQAERDQAYDLGFAPAGATQDGVAPRAGAGRV